jgi:hypothetical protein
MDFPFLDEKVVTNPQLLSPKFSISLDVPYRKGFFFARPPYLLSLLNLLMADLSGSSDKTDTR